MAVAGEVPDHITASLVQRPVGVWGWDEGLAVGVGRVGSEVDLGAIREAVAVAVRVGRVSGGQDACNTPGCHGRDAVGAHRRAPDRNVVKHSRGEAVEVVPEDELFVVHPHVPVAIAARGHVDGVDRHPVDIDDDLAVGAGAVVAHDRNVVPNLVFGNVGSDLSAADPRGSDRVRTARVKFELVGIGDLQEVVTGGISRIVSIALRDQSVVGVGIRAPEEG